MYQQTKYCQYVWDIEDGDVLSLINKEMKGAKSSPIAEKEFKKIDFICSDIDDAKNYLKKSDKSRNAGKQIRCVAVKYYDYTHVKYDDINVRKYEGLADIRWREYYALKDTCHYKDNKAAYISCPKCGSKICSAIYFNVDKGHNNCPVCDTDMRPKSTLEKIKDLKRHALDYDRKAKDLKKELREKSLVLTAVKWCARIEIV